jgi:hypothetical protein
MAKKTTDGDKNQDEGTGAESEEDGEEEETATGAGVESEEDDDSDGDEDDDAEAAIIATLTPEQAKLFTAVNEKLTKANASARSRRLALRALRNGQQNSTKTAPKPTAPKKEGDGKGAPAAFDPEAFKADLLSAFESKQESGKVQTAAEKELRRAGLILPDDEDAAERKLARVMRMLDLDGVPLDEVAEEVADLKTDNPELFGKRKKKRPAAGGVAGPARVSGGKAPDRVAELFD